MKDGRSSQFLAAVVELLQHFNRRRLVSLDGRKLVVYVRVPEKIISIVDHKGARAANFGCSDGCKPFVLVAGDLGTACLCKSHRP